MAVMSRLLPLVAYSTFAVFLLALLATPTNALAHEPRAHVARGHDAIAKRKRNPVKRAKRCRPQSSTLVSASPTSTSTPAPVSASAPASAPPAVTTSYSAPAEPTPEPTSEAPEPTTSQSVEPTTSQPASSTSQSAAPAPISTSVSIGGGSSGGSTGFDPNKKLLLAWPSGPTYLDNFQYGTRVAAVYNWSPYTMDNARIPYFPMLWGFKQKSSFTQLTKAGPGLVIMGFNEPNQGDQSNMSAQDGAGLWKESIQPLKSQGATLISPATTSAPSGKIWMQDMIKACGDGCGFDYLAIHWYGTKVDDFKAYVDDWCNTFGKPLVISEYACQDFSGGKQCTKQETETFHYTMASWFDQHQCVALYSPFGFMMDMGNVNPDNQLMGPDGTPNALGKWYLYH
ncbi:unnamed protein product [Rhizoctonia solani]|uniref:Asl1-like glycosyl hydrolase catalytic domain-containing protein n=1 Tax=Rhizoctonia solani TaxID=456999 RepID=A0A8H2WYD3_9AGAM|nr:unnamed protein product [Rhizoctonia solani]